MTTAVAQQGRGRSETRFNMVLPTGLLEAVQRLARDNDRSTSAEVRRAIAAHLEREASTNDTSPAAAHGACEQQVAEDAANVTTG
jgi:predicted transcriptional regulator